MNVVQFRPEGTTPFSQEVRQASVSINDVDFSSEDTRAKSEGFDNATMVEVDDVRGKYDLVFIKGPTNMYEAISRYKTEVLKRDDLHDETDGNDIVFRNGENGIVSRIEESELSRIYNLEEALKIYPKEELDGVDTRYNHNVHNLEEGGKWYMKKNYVTKLAK